MLAIGEPPHELLVLPQAPGVSSRIMRARWAVWRGGSNAGSWSLNGSISRLRSMMSLTSSPSNGSGNFMNGPLTTLQDENWLEVVVDGEGLVVAGHHEHAVVGLLPHRPRGPQGVEVRVRVVLDRPVPEEVRVQQIRHGI